MNEKVTEADVRKMAEWGLVPGSVDRYLNETPIPMLDGRTWQEVIAADDQDAMTKGLNHLRSFFGDPDD